MKYRNIFSTYSKEDEKKSKFDIPYVERSIFSESDNDEQVLLWFYHFVAKKEILKVEQYFNYHLENSPEPDLFSSILEFEIIPKLKHNNLTDKADYVKKWVSQDRHKRAILKTKDKPIFDKPPKKINKWKLQRDEEVKNANIKYLKLNLSYESRILRMAEEFSVSKFTIERILGVRK